MPEVSGEAAAAVDPRSVPGIAAALEHVLTDVGFAEDLARAGLARAARFTWEEAARMTLEVYEKSGSKR
jgi:glycosyltransferase involved in cell wall biosynthesis